jgi:transposase
MRTKVQLRELTADEQTALEKLARSRTTEARLVERAQLILSLAGGERPSQVAARLHITRSKGYVWLKRFNALGLEGLHDQSRSGRPPTYPSDQVATVVATALSKPDDLGLPFGSWTLDRLEQYLNEEKGIAIKRSRIDELLVAEGLRWRAQESWFGERLDPEFVQKRGTLKHSTPPHPNTV